MPNLKRMLRILRSERTALGKCGQRGNCFFQRNEQRMPASPTLSKSAIRESGYGSESPREPLGWPSLPASRFRAAKPAEVAIPTVVAYELEWHYAIR